MQDQDRVRRRAYELWEREGRPEGRDREHWEQARREIKAEGGASAPGQPVPCPTLAAPDGGETTPAQATAAAAAVSAPRTAEGGPG